VTNSPSGTPFGEIVPRCAWYRDSLARAAFATGARRSASSAPARLLTEIPVSLREPLKPLSPPVTLADGFGFTISTNRRRPFRRDCQARKSLAR
jgi:hypothetical protein